MALVTGGTARIGAGIDPEMFASEEPSVAFTGRTGSRPARRWKALQERGASAAYIQADSEVRGRTSQRRSRPLDEAYGPVTVLVNNAGGDYGVTISGVDNHVDEITSEDWDCTDRRPYRALLNTLGLQARDPADAVGRRRLHHPSSPPPPASARSAPARLPGLQGRDPTRLTRQMAESTTARRTSGPARSSLGFINTGGEIMRKLLARRAVLCRSSSGMIVLPAARRWPSRHRGRRRVPRLRRGPSTSPARFSCGRAGGASSHPNLILPRTHAVLTATPPSR